MPITTRPTPAFTNASEQGGVFPVWEQGSRVVYSVDPREWLPASSRQFTSACPAPTGIVQPSNSSPSGVTSTEPTHGFGDETRRAFSAFRIALSIISSSLGLLVDISYQSVSDVGLYCLQGA